MKHQKVGSNLAIIISFGILLASKKVKEQNFEGEFLWR